MLLEDDRETYKKQDPLIGEYANNYYDITGIFCNDVKIHFILRVIFYNYSNIT